MTLVILKKRSEFVRVAKVRNTVRRDTIWVQCLQNEFSGVSQFRVGFTASKKVGNAICRNRSKRRMRELARLFLSDILSDFPEFKGDFVFIAVPTTISCNYETLNQDFKSAVRRCIKRSTPASNDKS